MTYTCPRCGYETDRKSSITRHFDRKTKCESILKNVKLDTKALGKVLNKKNNKTDIIIYECSCKRVYNRLDNYKKHQTRCPSSRKENENDSTLKELVKMLNEQRQEDKKAISELKDLVKKAGITQNITNNITNNIVILPYKETDVSHLTGRDYYKALSRCVLSIPQLISDTHFNPNKPENHNIYISNISRGNAMIWDGSKWILKNQNEVIDNLIKENEYRLEDWVSEGSKKYPKAMEKFEKYIEKRDEKGVPELIRTEIKMMLYNNKDMIQESVKSSKDGPQIAEIVD
jgi:hypothetical protein